MEEKLINENTTKIIEIIDKLRPFLVNDGGNIEFIKYEDNIVYIKMKGACANCEMLSLTLKDGIEMAIKEEVPSVIEVINIG
ncbi:MAG: NifU family protein [Bacilli bacterium]|nr:NifU family protein [Bacilli bacterium]